MGIFFEFISTPDALIPACRKHPGAHVYPIEQGFALTPLPQIENLGDGYEFLVYRPTSGRSKSLPTLEINCGPAMADFIEVASNTAPMAYIAGSYLAGAGGWQVAAVWKKGRVILGPLELGWEFEKPAPKDNRMAPINLALRTIGVKAEPGRDEFASVTIDREPEAWFHNRIQPLDEIEQ